MCQRLGIYIYVCICTELSEKNGSIPIFIYIIYYIYDSLGPLFPQWWALYVPVDVSVSSQLMAARL